MSQEINGSDRRNHPFFNIYTKISPYFESWKSTPLFRINLVRVCGPLGHLSGGGGQRDCNSHRLSDLLRFRESTCDDNVEYSDRFGLHRPTSS
jgi:hypothetical protein